MGAWWVTTLKQATAQWHFEAKEAHLPGYEKTWIVRVVYSIERAHCTHILMDWMVRVTAVKRVLTRGLWCSKEFIHRITDASFTMLAHGKSICWALGIMCFGHYDNWVQSRMLLLGAWSAPATGAWLTPAADDLVPVVKSRTSNSRILQHSE